MISKRYGYTNAGDVKNNGKVLLVQKRHLYGVQTMYTSVPHLWIESLNSRQVNNFVQKSSLAAIEEKASLDNAVIQMPGEHQGNSKVMLLPLQAGARRRNGAKLHKTYFHVCPFFLACSLAINANFYTTLTSPLTEAPSFSMLEGSASKPAHRLWTV